MKETERGVHVNILSGLGMIEVDGESGNIYLRCQINGLETLLENLLKERAMKMG